MKARYDAKHCLVQYQLGDRVLFKLQPHCQLSLSSKRYTKLSPHYYGPFPILAKVGSMAYKLDLPSSKLHPVFHVSCLKPFHGTSVPIEPSLHVLTQGGTDPLPKTILDSRSVNNQHQVLVHWDELSPTDSSWEDVHSLCNRFPSFALEDKCRINGGGDVRSNHVDKKFAKGQVYQRRGWKVGAWRWEFGQQCIMLQLVDFMHISFQFLLLFPIFMIVSLDSAVVVPTL